MTTEPTQLRAGVTWAWSRSVPAYPSPTWEWTYYFKSPAAQFQITASADGSGGHSVTVLPVANGAYAPGRYDWYALVSDGADRYEVGRGVIEVLPNVVNTAPLDGRSVARRTLEMIDAYLADPGNLAARSYTIHNRTLERFTRVDLIKERDKWASHVRAEEASERLRKGQPARNRILTRG